MASIEIKLEPNSEGKTVYCSGHLLKGAVTLSLEEHKKFQGLYIKIFGRAKVHWTEKENRSRPGGGIFMSKNIFSASKKNFEAVDILLSSTTYLFGELYGPSIQIDQGIHQYNFECQLPDELPYTLDLKYGNIGYYVEAVLENSFGSYKSVRKTFTIVRFDDLNFYPDLKLLQNIEQVIKFGFALWRSKPLIMSATIPCSGFAVGQNVPVKIDYKNSSYVEIARTKVTLLRRITYTSYEPSAKKAENERIFVAYANGAKKDETKSVNVKFYIPMSMKSSNRRYCHIIAIDYAIEIIGEVSGYHKNPKILFPITIASLPLRYNEQNTDTSDTRHAGHSQQDVVSSNTSRTTHNRQNSQTSNVTSNQQTREPANVAENLLKNDALPSFEEALGMPKPIR